MRAGLLAPVLVLPLVLGGCTGPAPVAPSVPVPATLPAAVSTSAVAAPGPRATVPRAGHAVRPGRLARPVGHLVIASRGITARVRPVRFAGDRLTIPSSIAEVGFWVDGARLGDAVGTTVLVGHVSDDHDRPGMLGRLQGVRVGAEIRVAPDRGQAVRFRVVRVRSYDKGALPRRVFAQSGPHRLVVITCSHRVALPHGGFHYAQNLVVTARPVLRP